MRLTYVWWLSIALEAALGARQAPLPLAMTSTAASANPSDYVFFYGWKATSMYPRSLACFSQWWDQPFTDPSYPNTTFKTAEHYMMFRKAMLFDPDEAQAIVDAPTPSEAKQRGRAIKNFDKKRWDLHNDEIVETGSYRKFCSEGSDDIRGFLLDTKGKRMVEASPTDRIWGIGYSAKDAMAHQDNWGLNK